MQETSNNYFRSIKRCFIRRKRVSTSAEKRCWALLLYFDTRAYLFSLQEGSCYVFSTRNNWCEFLVSYDVIFQSHIQSVFTLWQNECANSYIIFAKAMRNDDWSIQQIISYILWHRCFKMHFKNRNFQRQSCCYNTFLLL